jgi:K+-sensing histidine kinase KdpD
LPKNEPNGKIEKILVGITVQHNSRRLIKCGYDLACAKSGQLHILHVQKGDNIFLEANAAELLQELYQYGSELGGETHAICGEDVCGCIIGFIENFGITHMILGESAKDAAVYADNALVKKIQQRFPELEIKILERA